MSKVSSAEALDLLSRRVALHTQSRVRDIAIVLPLPHAKAILAQRHSPPPSTNGPNPQLEQFVVDGTFQFPQCRGIPFAVLHDLDLRNRMVNLKTTV